MTQILQRQQLCARLRCLPISVNFARPDVGNSPLKKLSSTWSTISAVIFPMSGEIEPRNAFLFKSKACSDVIVYSDFGRRPDIRLSSSSRYVSLRSEPTSSGILPVMLLWSRERPVKSNKEKSSTGNLPVRLLSLRAIVVIGV